MSHRIIAAVSMLLMGMTTAQAGDKVFSGPQKGEKLTPFKVLAFSGQQAGKKVTLLPKKHKGPVMLVFVHEITRPAFQLLKPIDLYASKLAKDGLASHFIWLTADKSKTEAWLNRAKKSLRLRSPIVISLDGQEGPGNYGLNRKVTLTILVGKAGKTVANFAIIQPNETDAPKILKLLAKLMGKKKAPTLAGLQKELGIKRRKPGKTPEKLGILMRQLIQKTNKEADIKKTIVAIEKWAGDNQRKWTHVRRIGNVILRQEYGTEAARKAVRKLIKSR